MAVQYQKIREAMLWAERERRPFVEIIVKVKHRERPTILMNEDGQFEVIDDGLGESDRAIIARCEEWISEINERAVKMVTGVPDSPAPFATPFTNTRSGMGIPKS